MLSLDLTKRPTRHSYSSIKKYEECPFAYAASYIAKLPDEPTAAMMRGTRLHKLAEDYMGNVDLPVPYDIKRMGLTIYQLRSKGAKAEAVWRVNKDWEPVEKDSQARLKCIVDVHLLGNDILKLHDYKSGREYPTHKAQLELYATTGLRVFPDAVRADASALYFDSGKEGAQISIIRDMLPYYCRKWSESMDRIDDDREFRPTGGGHCKRCSLRSSAGGPCEGWRGHIPEGA